MNPFSNRTDSLGSLTTMWNLLLLLHLQTSPLPCASWYHWYWNLYIGTWESGAHPDPRAFPSVGKLHSPRVCFSVCLQNVLVNRSLCVLPLIFIYSILSLFKAQHKFHLLHEVPSKSIPKYHLHNISVLLQCWKINIVVVLSLVQHAIHLKIHSVALYF